MPQVRAGSLWFGKIIAFVDEQVGQKARVGDKEFVTPNIKGNQACVRVLVGNVDKELSGPLFVYEGSIDGAKDLLRFVSISREGPAAK